MSEKKELTQGSFDPSELERKPMCMADLRLLENARLYMSTPKDLEIFNMLPLDDHQKVELIKELTGISSR